MSILLRSHVVCNARARARDSAPVRPPQHAHRSSLIAGQGWTVLNGCYFIMVAISTVGYGDITPDTDEGKIFTIFFAVAGVGFIGNALGIILQWFLDQKEAAAKRGMKKMLAEASAAGDAVRVATGTTPHPDSPKKMPASSSPGSPLRPLLLQGSPAGSAGSPLAVAAPPAPDPAEDRRAGRAAAVVGPSVQLPPPTATSAGARPINPTVRMALPLPSISSTAAKSMRVAPDLGASGSEQGPVAGKQPPKLDKGRRSSTKGHKKVHGGGKNRPSMSAMQSLLARGAPVGVTAPQEQAGGRAHWHSATGAGASLGVTPGSAFEDSRATGGECGRGVANSSGCVASSGGVDANSSSSGAEGSAASDPAEARLQLEAAIAARDWITAGELQKQLDTLNFADVGSRVETAGAAGEGTGVAAAAPSAGAAAEAGVGGGNPNGGDSDRGGRGVDSGGKQETPGAATAKGGSETKESEDGKAEEAGGGECRGFADDDEEELEIIMRLTTRERLWACCSLQALRSKYDHIVRVLKCMTPVFVFLLLGLFMMLIEEWAFVDTMYYAVSTLTTIGFGDFSPQSKTGRTFAIFYLPFGVTIVSNVIGKLHELSNKANAKEEKGLSTMLAELQEVIDADEDGTVSSEEYVIFCLKKMNKVDQETLDILDSQFQALDADGSGELDQDDIEQLQDMALAQTQ